MITSFEQISDFSELVPMMLGNGAVLKIAERAKALGATRVLLVEDPHLPKAIAEAVHESFEKAGLALVIYDDLIPEVPEHCIAHGCELVRAAGGVDCVVGLGGGSCLDAAKAINLMLNNPEPISRYFFPGGGMPESVGYPIILCPTTAGTGSEQSGSAMIHDASNGEKRIVLAMTGSLAVLDPALTLTVPREVTAMTGVDAFCHAYEAFNGMPARRSAIGDLLCQDVMRLIITYLPLLMEDLSNTEYREKMMLASGISGILIQNLRNTLGHAIAHALGSTCPAPHGACCAHVEPFVAEFLTVTCRYERNREVLRLFGQEVPDGTSPQELGARLRDAMAAFFARVGVEKLPRYGGTRENITAAAPVANADAILQRFKDEGGAMDPAGVDTLLESVCRYNGL